MKSLTDLAADLDVSTEQVLVALRVVAYRAGVDDLAEWAAKELEGYEQEDELPAHRQWKLTIRADLYNPYQAYVPDAEIPLPKKFKEAGIYRCFDGIGRLEGILSGSEPGQQLGAEHPDLARIVRTALQPGWNCIQARAVFSAQHLQEIVDRSRQTALKYCLECEKEGIILQFGGEEVETDSQQQRTAWKSALTLEVAKHTLKEIWDQAF